MTLRIQHRVFQPAHVNNNFTLHLLLVWIATVASIQLHPNNGIVVFNLLYYILHWFVTHAMLLNMLLMFCTSECSICCALPAVAQLFCCLFCYPVKCAL